MNRIIAQEEVTYTIIHDVHKGLFNVFKIERNPLIMDINPKPVLTIPQRLMNELIIKILNKDIKITSEHKIE